jgi:light-regulated signal transduction histidine kinase (bacteriophytochrome)
MITKDKKEEIFGKAIGQLIHDIRNPLNIVIGFSSILQIDETINDEIRLYIQNILYSSFKIEELLSNIDNYFSDDDDCLSIEKFSVLDEWNRFLKQQANDINDKEIRIITQIDENLKIDFVKEKFSYLLCSLFNFSLKGMKKTTNNEIIIRAEKKEQNIIFYYSDSTSPTFIESNYFSYKEVESRKRGLFPLFIEKIVEDTNGNVNYFFGRKWHDLTIDFFSKKTDHGFIFSLPQS